MQQRHDDNLFIIQNFPSHQIWQLILNKLIKSLEERDKPVHCTKNCPFKIGVCIQSKSIMFATIMPHSKLYKRDSRKFNSFSQEQQVLGREFSHRERITLSSYKKRIQEKKRGIANQRIKFTMLSIHTIKYSITRHTIIGQPNAFCR